MVVPLLGAAVGVRALPAIVAILAVAYGAGAVIRFNIRHVESLLEGGDAPGPVRLLERFGDVTLSLASSDSLPETTRTPHLEAYSA